MSKLRKNFRRRVDLAKGGRQDFNAANQDEIIER